MKENEKLNWSRLKMISIKDRRHLVEVSQFVEPSDPPGDFLGGMPDLLGAKGLKRLCLRMAEAKAAGRPVVLAMGAHPIKCGLSLLLIDLMERGLVSALALNGAGAIHDWEIAYAGATSEAVADTLQDGSFGMVLETPRAMQAAAWRAAREGIGYGEALGKEIKVSEFPFKRYSLFAAAERLNIPATVHVCMGCDTVHMSAEADGGHIGRASLEDFRLLCQVVAGLEGGVWINLGSAVVLPEVFLKALTVARNLTGGPRRFCTADLDMIRHYRPQQNVLARPGGEGIALTGHHEILVPLLRWGAILQARRTRKSRGRGSE